MAVYLIKTTEQYRCDTEEEAKEFIEKEKENLQYEVIKHSTETKIKKATKKDPQSDEWQRVIITKVFTDEKEPSGYCMPKYVDKREENDEN